MMGDVLFFSILSGVIGLFSGIGGTLIWVFLGEMEGSSAMHRRNRIDAARIEGGDLKPVGFRVSPSEILKLKGNFPQDDGGRS